MLPPCQPSTRSISTGQTVYGIAEEIHPSGPILAKAAPGRIEDYDVPCHNLRRQQLDTIFFDKSLPGFGLRIHPSGRNVWIVQARIERRSRRIVIARHGEWDLAQARRRTRDMLARIRAGQNRADDIKREKEAPALREFAAEYLRRCDPLWKPSGRETARIYLKARILPAFGKMPLDRIGPEDVAVWFDAASRDKPGAANRAFEILRSMMFRTEEWGFASQTATPVSASRRNRGIMSLGSSTSTSWCGSGARSMPAKPNGRRPVAAIRLLALTGCRRGEVLTLRWRDIGADVINLPDSKTGPRAVPLGEAARAQIDALPGMRRPGAFLFPKLSGGRYSHSLVVCWRAVCAEANLGRMRLHDLRHTAVSQAVMSGEDLPLGGRLLGHRRHRTTAGYARLDDGHLVDAGEKVRGIIAAAMAAKLSFS